MPLSAGQPQVSELAAQKRVPYRGAGQCPLGEWVSEPRCRTDTRAAGSLQASITSKAVAAFCHSCDAYLHSTESSRSMKHVCLLVHGVMLTL